MGGLGNGRRGGRSPPLMIGALIACILVLGFNYWVSSSRNLELQTKLYELEGQLRRGAAERGVAENKRNEYQEEIQRQKEQMSHLESMYKRQLEGAQNICNQERVPLQQNISTSTKTIQDLKGQLNQLNEYLGKLQKDLQSCQGNINTLNNKLTYDMTHCHSQVLAQKEMCDERVAAAKVEAQKKMEKLVSPQGGQGVNGEVKEELVTGSSLLKTPATVSHTLLANQPKGGETFDLLTSNNLPDNDAAVQPPLSQVLPQKEIHSVPSSNVVTHLPEANQPVKSEEGNAETNKLSTNNLTDMQVMDANEEGIQTEDADPGMEGMLVGQGKDDTPVGQKVDDSDDYDQDLQVTDGVDLDKQLQSKQTENTDRGMEEELADYNGDDENEGEFEADKQAELAQI